MKRCIGPCGKELEISCFEFRRDTGKYRNECKNCRREYYKNYIATKKDSVIKDQKEYYNNNKESILQLKRDKYKANKEEISKANKQHRLENLNEARKSDKKNYDKNKEKISKRSKAKYLLNKEKISESNKNYREKDKEQTKKKRRESYQRNKDTAIRYREKNKDKISEYNKEYKLKNKPSKQSSKNKEKSKKNKRKNNPAFRIREIISVSIRKILKSQGNSKNGLSCLSGLGKNYHKLIYAHIESLFESWMTWDNQGKYNKNTWNDSDPTTWTWNIDHIIPHSSFYYESPNDLNCLRAWSLANLRPLSSKDNVLKGNRISDELYTITMAKIEEELRKRI